MPDRRSFLTAAGAALALPGRVWAGAAVLSAPEANDRLGDGSLILVDIRTPEEWQQTGVARKAWPLDMRHQSFGSWITAAIDRNPKQDVAVICRTGNRSGYLVQVLEQNGITGVLDVTEGMAGGRNGKGWIPRGLPIVSAQEAFDAMPKDLTLT